MPHLTLEYSANVIKPNFAELFQQCHTALANGLPTQVAHCKSRAIQCDTYYEGDGNPRNAFVHVTVLIMPGRTDQTVNAAGQKLIEILRSFFSESEKILNLQISLEIRELKHYFKIG